MEAFKISMKMIMIVKILVIIYTYFSWVIRSTDYHKLIWTMLSQALSYCTPRAMLGLQLQCLETIIKHYVYRYKHHCFQLQEAYKYI